MQFAKPRALMCWSALPAMLLLGSGCVSAPPIVAASRACSSLLPSEWREPVPGAPLPEGSSVGEWLAFGDAQTGQLDKANDRTLSAIGIVERCEARDREAVSKARPKFLGVF
jgi:hypothetical protein